MFKTKEPLLNVGPAGVDGNNKTRTMPSPSKMKGYAMKSSPFKQKVKYRTDENGNLVAVLQSQENDPWQCRFFWIFRTGWKRRYI